MTHPNFDKTLFVGGTGMLSEASGYLAKHSKHLTLAARKPEALATNLAATGIVIDWTDHKETVAAIDLLPEMDIVVSWVHDNGVWLLPHLESKIKTGGRSIRIHGSKSGNPAIMAKQNPALRSGISRQNVILGWQSSSSDRRWLSHEEICSGVINAISNCSTPLVIVGTLDD